MDAVPIGKYFITLAPLTGVKLIVDPAVNQGGLIIRTGLINPHSASVKLAAGLVAPTSPTDPNQRIIFAGNGYAVAEAASEIVLSYPLFVPAGMGLWVSTNTNGKGTIPLTWDLLA